MTELSCKKPWAMAQVALLALCLFVVPRAADAKSTHGVHTITIVGMKFVPAQIDVHAGDTIEWKNEDILPHTATAENKSFDSGAINPGKSWRFTARKKGTVSYACTFHPTMKGAFVAK